MKRKHPEVRQFGQLPLPSSFLSPSRVASCVNAKDCKEAEEKKPSKLGISLSEFLNRKVVKPIPKCVQEKQSCFMSIRSSVHEHTGVKKDELQTDFVLSEAAFLHFKHTEKDPNHAETSGAVQVEECISTADNEGSTNRNNPFIVSKGGLGRPAVPRYLVVLGEDPKPKQRRIKQRFINRKTNIFNHYANGSGWWDCDMEGVDTEEVGCNEAWEGIGSTSLGGLEWH